MQGSKMRFQAHESTPRNEPFRVPETRKHLRWRFICKRVAWRFTGPDVRYVVVIFHTATYPETLRTHTGAGHLCEKGFILSCIKESAISMPRRLQRCRSHLWHQGGLFYFILLHNLCDCVPPRWCSYLKMKSSFVIEEHMNWIAIPLPRTRGISDLIYAENK